jgi:uncharacterized protein YjeT (DUF2065 family)
MELETMRLIGMVAFMVGMVVVFGSMYLDSKK